MTTQNGRELWEQTYDCVDEPQAQAGEPGVVAYVLNKENLLDTRLLGYKPDDEDCIELITLQSHREAMEAQRKAIEFEAWEYRERYVPMLKEEIAKRDAALKACVDWMIGNATHQAGCGLYGFLGKCSCGLDSAITQAKGAQG